MKNKKKYKESKKSKRNVSEEELYLDLEFLKEMYWIHSPSGHEFGLQGYIRNILTKMRIPFKIDEYNQTYNLSYKDKPMLCAHADQVGKTPLTSLVHEKGKIKGDANLGADDKNGIFIILNLLAEYKLNFVFSTEEEIGGNLQELLGKKILKDISYCLVFDRKGRSDIIGESNDYCCKDFEREIAAIGAPFGLTPGMGVWSDCDCISRYINCVNISCGYYNAHTTKEYTRVKDVLKALTFAKEVIESDMHLMEFEKPLNSFHNRFLRRGWKNNDYAHNHNPYDSLFDKQEKDRLDYLNYNSIESYECPNCGDGLIAYSNQPSHDYPYSENGLICPSCHYDSEDFEEDDIDFEKDNDLFSGKLKGGML